MAAKRPPPSGSGASVLSKPLPAGRGVNISSFAFLFAELVAYHRGRSAAISDLETKYVAATGDGRAGGLVMRSHARARVARTTRNSLSPLCARRRLEQAGYPIGARFLELLALRERAGKREVTVVGMLQFVSSTVWQSLFGKTADALEKSTDTANAYMIRDDEPLTNAFISVPKDLARFNPAAFMAGIVRGVLDSAGFPCTVQAVTVAGDGPRDKTVFLVTFDAAVAGES